MKRKRHILKTPVSLIILFFALVGVLEYLEIRLPAFFRDTITLSLGIVYEAFPFVLLGTVLAAIVRCFVPENFFVRFLPKKSIARRATLSVSGAFLPVCECGNVPLARGLMSKGVSPQDAMTFILAAPIINPVTALTTQQAFSTQPLLLPLRLFGAFFTANLVGWIFDDKKSSKSMLNRSFKDYCETCLDEDRKATKTKRSLKLELSRFSRTFQDELSTLISPLLIGSFIAGIVQTTIPRTWLSQVASEPVLAILLMLLLAFIVSICANVDAFFALSFSGIFPMSAILAFLVFGPMVDMKMLALLRTTYTTKTLVKVSSLVFLCSFCIGLGAHYVI